MLERPAMLLIIVVSGLSNTSGFTAKIKAAMKTATEISRFGKIRERVSGTLGASTRLEVLARVVCFICLASRSLAWEVYQGRHKSRVNAD